MIEDASVLGVPLDLRPAMSWFDSQSPTTVAIKGRLPLLAVAAALGCLPMVIAVAEDKILPAAVAEGPLSKQEVENFLQDLDHDQFVIRENASRKLLLAGPEVFDLLAATADDVKPEAASRALQVLLAKSRSENHAEAVAALQRVAELQNWPAHRRAAEQRMDSMAEQIAVAEVQRLGGLARELRKNVHGDSVIARLHIGEDWQGGNEGFKQIGRLKSLEFLTVYYADISDEAIATLAELPRLQQVQLYGTDATLEGVAKLRAKLPQTDIQLRKGALLGVRGSIAGGIHGGALVDEVQPNTAAQRAGLQNGDLIIKFNGNPIADFNGLTDHISRFKPSEKAKLTVRRGGEEFETEVEFGRWRVDQFEQ